MARDLYALDNKRNLMMGTAKTKKFQAKRGNCAMTASYLYKMICFWKSHDRHHMLLEWLDEHIEEKIPSQKQQSHLAFPGSEDAV